MTSVDSTLNTFDSSWAAVLPSRFAAFTALVAFVALVAVVAVSAVVALSAVFALSASTAFATDSPGAALSICFFAIDFTFALVILADRVLRDRRADERETE